MNNITLLVGRGSDFYDISELVTKVTTSGKLGSPTRTLEAIIYDSELLAKRAPVDCSEGQTVVFYDGNEECFQGLLMSEKYGNGRTLTLKAYDMCIRLSNNKDSFTYNNSRADQIFSDCCRRLGLEVGKVANTGHVIGELVKKSSTYWDVIQDALSQTYKTTGNRFFVYAYMGKVNLINRVQQNTMPLLDLDSNVITYDRTRSIEKTRTRLKLVTSEGETKNSTILSDLENKIGQFQEYESVDEQITSTELSQRVSAFKLEKGMIDQSLKIKTFGDNSIWAGWSVYVHIDNIGTKRIMYVEEDQHVWEKGGHTMTLKLDYAKTEVAKQAATVRDLKIGDTGDDVLALQKKLRTFGYYWDGALDGWFWVITDKAVKQFQRAYGLYVDGIVGPVTRNALGM